MNYHDWRNLGCCEGSDENIFRCWRCSRVLRVRPGVFGWSYDNDAGRTAVESDCPIPEDAEWIGFGWMLPVVQHGLDTLHPEQRAALNPPKRMFEVVIAPGKRGEAAS